MLWIAIAVALVVGLAVLAVIHAQHPVDVRELGSVSSNWLAQHRVDAP